MAFPTKNDRFGVWNGGTTILRSFKETPISSYPLSADTFEHDFPFGQVGYVIVPWRVK